MTVGNIMTNDFEKLARASLTTSSSPVVLEAHVRHSSTMAHGRAAKHCPDASMPRVPKVTSSNLANWMEFGPLPCWVPADIEELSDSPGSQRGTSGDLAVGIKSREIGRSPVDSVAGT